VSLLDAGHQVRPTATDEDVLKQATLEGRAVVTRNLRDYLALHRAWAATERRHCGVVLIHSRSVPEGNRGAEVRALLALLRRLPKDDALVDSVHWVGAHP
jgi:hypothetical protein